MNEFRTAFFIPGGNEKMLGKASSIAADLIIFDLEDSVVESDKPRARQLVQRTLRERHRGEQCIAVRVNAMDTGHLQADLAAVMVGAPEIILLPKLEAGEQLTQLAEQLDQLEADNGISPGSTKIIAITAETPRGIFGLDSIDNSSQRLVGLSWGPEDLATELGAPANRDAQGNFLPPFELVRSLCLAKARELGVQPLDTVFTDFRNPEGLAAECASARRIGYSGKLAIHPAQIDIINQAFSPSEDEVAHAQKLVDLFAANPGAGALQLDGRMVDIPHLRLAEQILAKAARISSAAGH